MKLLLLIAALLLPVAAHGQVACFQYPGMLSCNTPSGITNVTPLGPTGGVITEYWSGKNTLEPYTIMTPEPRSRRPHSLDLAPLEPLPSLLGPPALPELELPGLGLPGLELP